MPEPDVSAGTIIKIIFKAGFHAGNSLFQAKHQVLTQKEKAYQKKDATDR